MKTGSWNAIDCHCKNTPGDTAGLAGAEYTLLAAFLALLSVPLLYICRFLDDNTLTSWKWVFAGAGMERILLFLALAVLLSFFVSQRLAIEKRPLLSLALLGGAAVLPLWSEPEVLLDSSRYFLQAKHLSQYGLTSFLSQWGQSVSAWTDMPLIPFCYGMLFKLFGETRTVIQCFNTVIFVLTMLVTFLIGRELWDETTGFYGAMLLLGIPYLLTQVPLMLVDIHTMFFITLAAFTFLKATRIGGPFWIPAAALALACAVLTKYSTLPMLAIFPLITLALLPEQGMAAVYRGAAAAAMAGGIAGLFLLQKLTVVQQQAAILRHYQWPALSLWQEGLASSFFFQTHPFISLLALFAVYRAFKKKDRLFLIPGSFLLLVLLLDMRRIRYMLPLLPLFTLMAAYGLGAIQDNRLKRFSACSIVASSAVVLFAAYLPFLQSTSMMNIKNAGLFLDTLDAEAIEVCAAPQELSAGNTVMAIPQLDLFTRKQLIVRNWPAAAPKDLPPYSPLRFSWEVQKPLFYSETGRTGPLPRLVIAGGSRTDHPCKETGADRPAEAGRHFALQTGIFRYKTLVTVSR